MWAPRTYGVSGATGQLLNMAVFLFNGFYFFITGHNHKSPNILN